jgi:hypothetical protein
MAEILVAAISKTNILFPEKEMALYKRGMPVVVMPDGHPWGAKEGLPDFVVIKIPGVPVSTLQTLTDVQTEDALGVETGSMVRRRRWVLDVDTINFVGGITTLPIVQLATKASRIRDGFKWQP